MVQPILSVVVPSFNCRFLGECVESVFSQTYQNFELIVVDCSTDDACLRILDELRHPKLTIYRRKDRHLPGDNRNFGIERASGEFIVCLDADDVILPTFLEEGLFTICCAGYSLVGTSFETFGVMERRIKVYSHPTLDDIANGDAFVVTNLFRKSLWAELGGFHDHALGREHIPEDWDFLVRALASGATLYNRGSYGFRYRKHWDSITAQPDLPPREEMKSRIWARHAPVLTQLDRMRPEKPTMDANGWKSLVTDQPLRETALVVLPDQINAVLVRQIEKALAQCNGSPTVICTCEIDAVPQDFFASLHAPEVFSLPDFLEHNRSLWLEFLKYLRASRNVTEVLYGQNAFFVNALSADRTLFADCSPKYLSRYEVQSSQNLPGS